METNHLLESIEISYVQASHGKRFVNFLVDFLGFFVLLIFMSVVAAIIFPEALQGFDEESGSPASDDLLWNIIFIMLYIGWYMLIEFATGGRSLGKFLTGTKVVTLDGSPLTLSILFKRSAIRLIPFEVFSYFGNPCFPWHDRWSNTMVIDIRQSQV
jgi:uncharacterized RDD family membrane protein YckC